MQVEAREEQCIHFHCVPGQEGCVDDSGDVLGMVYVGCVRTYVRVASVCEGVLQSAGVVWVGVAVRVRPVHLSAGSHIHGCAFCGHL